MRFEGVKAVLFDLDNTLIARPLTLRKLSHYINRFFFPDRPEEHGTIAEIFCSCFQSGYENLQACFARFQTLTGWTSPAGYPEFRAMWDFYYPFCTCMEPHAASVLELKKMGYRIGILTNGTSLLQQGKVDVVGFRDWFEFVVATREIGPDKPAPDSFRLVAERMGLKPREIVYVGDHPENDVEAPRSAGMHTVWFSAYADWDDRFAPAEAEIASLTELPGLFPARNLNIM